MTDTLLVKCLSLIYLLCFTICAFAADFSTINKASVETFIEFLPKYKAILEKMDQTPNPEGQIPLASQYAEQIKDLFEKYNISMEQFPQFMQKITMGLASLQMEKSGLSGQMGNMLGAMMGQSGTKLTDPELSTLKNYEDQLNEVLSEE